MTRPLQSPGSALVALLLIAAGLLLLAHPGLMPAFEPAGALHGPIPFDAAPPLLVRVHGAALVLLGAGIALASRMRGRQGRD
jgi:hypothetical protein